MPTNISPILLLLIIVALHSAAATFNGHDRPDTGEPGGVIVHLMDWRYDDIAYECEKFLSKRGFAGVQVSPVTEYLQTSGLSQWLWKFTGIVPWYDRHQVVSYDINTPSGNEKDFTIMVERCNKAGIKVYVDVVLNHMTAAYTTVTTGYAGSKVDTVNFQYPAIPYTKEDFNTPTCGFREINAITMRNCEVLGLHDLNQTNPCVREKMRGFLNKLISIGVAGFRVGHVKHMWPEDLKKLLGRLDYLNCTQGFACETPPYIYQDYFDIDTKSPVKVSEYVDTGLVTEYNYARKISNIFHHYEKPVQFADIKDTWRLLDSKKSIVFVDTYESQQESATRNIISFTETKLYKLAAVLMLASPYGQPLITSSYVNAKYGSPPYAEHNGKLGSTTEQGTCADGWICEHRLKFICKMLTFRKVVGDAPVTNWWHDGRYQFAFSRGDKGFVLFNNNAKAIREQRFKTGLSKGTYCDIISGAYDSSEGCTGDSVKVEADGSATISLASSDKGYGVLAIHTSAKMA